MMGHTHKYESRHTNTLFFHVRVQSVLGGDTCHFRLRVLGHRRLRVLGGDIRHRRLRIPDHCRLQVSGHCRLRDLGHRRQRVMCVITRTHIERACPGAQQNKRSARGHRPPQGAAARAHSTLSLLLPEPVSATAIAPIAAVAPCSRFSNSE